MAVVASAGPVLSVITSAKQSAHERVITLTRFHAIYLDIGTFAVILGLGRGDGTAGL